MIGHGGRDRSGRSMLDRLSQFLFDNYSVAGLQFENWMWMIGVPTVLFLAYFFERGFHWKPDRTPDDPRN
jgi:hypothetical protein